MLATHCSVFFFFNDTATTEIYTLSLHDALPISVRTGLGMTMKRDWARSPAEKSSGDRSSTEWTAPEIARSEEHTSELQSPDHLVCRLLLEKKKIIKSIETPSTAAELCELDLSVD